MRAALPDLWWHFPCLRHAGGREPGDDRRRPAVHEPYRLTSAPMYGLPSGARPRPRPHTRSGCNAAGVDAAERNVVAEHEAAVQCPEVEGMRNPTPEAPIRHAIASGDSRAGTSATRVGAAVHSTSTSARRPESGSASWWYVAPRANRGGRGSPARSSGRCGTWSITGQPGHLIEPQRAPADRAGPSEPHGACRVAVNH